MGWNEIMRSYEGSFCTFKPARMQRNAEQADTHRNILAGRRKEGQDKNRRYYAMRPQASRAAAYKKPHFQLKDNAVRFIRVTEKSHTLPPGCAFLDFRQVAKKESQLPALYPPGSRMVLQMIRGEEVEDVIVSVRSYSPMMPKQRTGRVMVENLPPPLV